MAKHTLAVMLAILLPAPLICAQESDSLVAGFENPPPEARPLAYWQWINGNVSEEGIRRDLDWMHRVGMGGVFMFDIAFGSPPIPQYVEERIGFDTERWRRAVKVAAEEAERLGLSFGMQSSGGWSVSGGPGVTPPNAMKKLVWSETVVTPDDNDVIIPPPPRASGPFQDFPTRESYRDPVLGGEIAVIAYRLPESETLPRIPAEISGVDEPELLRDMRFDAATASNDDGDVSITYSFSRPVAPGAFTLSVDGAIPPGALVDETGTTRVELPGPAQTRAAAQTYTLDRTPSQIWRLQFPGTPGALRIREARFDFGARINRFEEKAGFGTLSDYQDIGDSEELPGIDKQTIIDVSDRVDVNGTLHWRPSEGHWQVLRFGWSLTGRRVVPASPESLGLEVDKLDDEAVREFANHFFDRLTSAVGSEGRLDIALTDSWEAGVLNWSEDLVAEFERRRGYDPLPWFPALAGRVVGDVRASERFLADWRRTIADLIADNHYQVFNDVLRQRRITYYAEAPGTNMPTIADGIQSKRRVSVPMGEYWYWPEGTSPKGEHVADIREAASAAHIEGRRIVAAEALTTMGEEPWAMGPAQWRRMVDRFFAEGVNRIVMHTSAHQPFLDRYPGMTLRQYGQHFTRNEAWAELAHGWVAYLSRASFMLQQGEPVADVAVFYGDHAAVSPPYDVSLRPVGYDMDFIDRETLQRLEYRDGWLRTPAGARYRALMMRPGLGRQSQATLASIARLQNAGAPIIYDSPERALRELGIQPDVVSAPRPLDWTHRQLDDGDIYFVSNPGADPFDGQVWLRASAASADAHAEIWDASAGHRNSIPGRWTPTGFEIELSLPAHGSVFVVIRPGRPAPARLLPTENLVTLTGPWDVAFIDGMGAPATTQFESLRSWTEHDDPAIRHYSGRAVYRTSFEYSGGTPDEVGINLGEIGEMARVRLNGHDIGIVWQSPTRLHLGSALREGTNVIEVEVANYWRNRLVGDRQADAEQYTFAPISPYDASTALRPSGLIGPVTLERLSSATPGSVLPSLADHLVSYYDFDHPLQGADNREADLGFSGTILHLVNGGAAMRVDDAAYPDAGQSLQTRQVNPTKNGNDDWKAGVFDNNGIATLSAFSGAREITLMGWVKPTGSHPSPNSLTEDPNDTYNAIGLFGILSGNSDGHNVRALLEVINVSGTQRLVALGRRDDEGNSLILAADEDWETLLPEGAWTHLAATFDFDRGTMALYRNGERLRASYTSTQDRWAVTGDPEPDVTSSTNPAGIKIGGSFPQNSSEKNAFNGRFDDLMFFDRELTASEIRNQFLHFHSASSVMPIDPTLLAAAADERPRVIVTSDGEIDDECSLVRFLLYANEWDIEGIITSSSQYHWQGHNWAGDDWAQPYLEAYARVRPTLIKHDPRYPTADYLQARTLLGNVKAEGEMDEVTPGSQHIVKVLLDESDNRPVWLQAWGGTNTIARALKTIEEQHPEKMAYVANKMRFFFIWEQDRTYQEYIRPHWGKYQILTIISDQFWAIAYQWKKIQPQDKQRYFEASWMKENILNNHGPLCSLYEAHKEGSHGLSGDFDFFVGDFRSEGDSPAFLHVIDTGLRNLESPGWGGWGGRYVRVRENTWLDPVPVAGYTHPEGRWYTRSAWGRSSMREGSQSTPEQRQEYFKPMWRWSEAIQNDFAARADWSVKSYEQANHPPQVKLAHASNLRAMPGAKLTLSAEGTSDPDGDEFSIRWWQYREAGSYEGIVEIEKADTERATLTVPEDVGKGETIHVIVEVTDSGTPALTRYQRVVIETD